MSFNAAIYNGCRKVIDTYSETNPFFVAADGLLSKHFGRLSGGRRRRGLSNICRRNWNVREAYLYGKLRKR